MHAHHLKEEGASVGVCGIEYERTVQARIRPTDRLMYYRTMRATVAIALSTTGTRERRRDSFHVEWTGEVAELANEWLRAKLPGADSVMTWQTEPT